MSHAVAKRANSVDPRDWHYLEFWQRWQDPMPPFNWKWYAPAAGMPSFIPFFGFPVALNKQNDGIGEDSITWDIDVTVPLPVVGPTPIFYFNADLNTFDPSAPPLDPGGNPYTLQITGGFIVGGNVLSECLAFFNGYFFEPAYNTEFVIPLTIVVDFLLWPLDGTISIVPCKWDTPAIG